MKIKVGIFFGGPSREREISFAGGRTVYDNLNKSIFEPLPIFVDSHKNFILLNWQYIYKGSIRDFFPPVDQLPTSPNAFQVYLESLGELDAEQQEKLIQAVGQKIEVKDLPNIIDVAFLALHGIYGEDGQIQQELHDLYIPYTGSGIKASQIGMDKALQKELMGEKGFPKPEVQVLNRAEWIEGNAEEYYQSASDVIGFPMVIRPANQGSSIGVSIIYEKEGLARFEQCVNRAFFVERIFSGDWLNKTKEERVGYIRELTDIRHGLGFPLEAKVGETTCTIYHPEELLNYLDTAITKEENEHSIFELSGHLKEEKVILEAFIDGQEFSCIVVQKEDGAVVALPPTEIKKGKEVFDYRSKYLPGLSRKVTPIDLPEEDINAIRSECERLFLELDFQTYARIDGFIQADQTIYLNDPNTTSGMLPSSFFFHQAAEIGLNPSQFLTYIIRISIQERNQERVKEAPYTELQLRLDAAIHSLKSANNQKRKIGVILGGYSFERHISVESGRNIFEKLASSEKYEPIPIFLSGNELEYRLFQLPINLLLKDNADDIRDKVATYAKHPVIEDIKDICQSITNKYASDQVVFEPLELSFSDLKAQVDGVFIALHGRPGEDGQLQMELEAHGIPYNGSGIQSSSTTINKYKTLQILKEQGFEVAEQTLGRAEDYQQDPQEFYARIESRYEYPFIAKPIDDGCSSAVKVLKNRDELEAFVRMMFRPGGHPGTEARRTLGLSDKEEFPIKGEILFETLITANGAKHFLEITGGLLTHYDPNGGLQYQAFEPSETLASGGILSLEEKFLAGEGQNITPARFSNDIASSKLISSKVKADLEKVAAILGVEGYARIDAFVRIFEDNRIETIVIEVNSLPGMTPATCIFHQAALRDYKPYEFIDRILTFAFQRQRMNLAKARATTQKEVKEIKTPAVVEENVAPISVGVRTTENIVHKEIEKPKVEKVTFPTPPKFGNQTFGERSRNFFMWLIGNIWAFIKSPIFIKNLIAITVLLAGLFWLTSIWLNSYTKHGQSVEVQEYVDMRLDQARRKAERRSFELVVMDSTWVPNKPGGVVYSQTPEEGSRVKKNRRIYVKVTKFQGDTKKLPAFKDSGYDFYNYQRRLRSMNIRSLVKDKEFSSKLAENSILHLYYKGEKVTDEMVTEGFEVPQGAELEFVITQRQMNSVPIPNLICKRFEAANFILQSNNLILGKVVGQVENRNSAFIWKQEPTAEPGQMIPTGQQIDIYLMNNRPSGCPEELDPSDLDRKEEEESEDFEEDDFDNNH